MVCCDQTQSPTGCSDLKKAMSVVSFGMFFGRNRVAGNVFPAVLAVIADFTFKVHCALIRVSLDFTVQLLQRSDSGHHHYAKYECRFLKFFR